MISEYRIFQGSVILSGKPNVFTLLLHLVFVFVLINSFLIVWGMDSVFGAELVRSFGFPHGELTTNSVVQWRIKESIKPTNIALKNWPKEDKSATVLLIWTLRAESTVHHRGFAMARTKLQFHATHNGEVFNATPGTQETF